MQQIMHTTVLLFITILQSVSAHLYNETDNAGSSSKILSRKKRYLVFPEGSSFQLVYCLTVPTYGVGTIFTMGLTAALAWELPHEPIDFKKEKNNDADKRIDTPTKTKILPVNKYPVTNWSKPHWSTYSGTRTPQYINIHSFMSQNENQPTKFQTHYDSVENWDHHLPPYRNEYLYRQHGQVHRRTRRELFAKIEKFFDAQNKDGKACLLKALCEVNQTSNSKKGTFIEEILRAIFTWVPSDEENEDIHYNTAASQTGNCTKLFPTCTHSVWNPFL